MLILSSVRCSAAPKLAEEGTGEGTLLSKDVSGDAEISVVAVDSVVDGIVRGGTCEVGAQPTCSFVAGSEKGAIGEGVEDTGLLSSLQSSNIAQFSGFPHSWLLSPLSRCCIRIKIRSITKGGEGSVIMTVVGVIPVQYPPEGPEGPWLLGPIGSRNQY